MNVFINDDFLLQNDTARHLYHDYAKNMPIIDFHCHLDPKAIAENKNYDSITQIWLGGDHYKWRAMRANGVNERFITGDASDWEKFEKWAETVPYAMRNPLYHWTHMELKTAFGIDDILNPKSARMIYDRCNELLAQPEFTPQEIIKRYHVETLCTTDDPIDSLEYHAQLAQSDFSVRVLPAWRPDKVMTVTTSDEYRAYVEKLSEVSGISISSFTDLLDALQNRHDYFNAKGCRLADHGMGEIADVDYTMSEIEAIFQKVYGGEELNSCEKQKYQLALLVILAEMNAEAGWTQQFHYGPLRNTNTKMFNSIGVDTGFDTIGDFSCAQAIAHLLDRLNTVDKLAKTIIYNINPAENEMIAAMIANFQDGSVPGKIQFGAAWWFNDQMFGMINQMNSLSSQGLLSRFVGMLTDSRSFLSYTRHEYFRRILCNLLGKDVEDGIIPVSEMERVEGMVEDICYNNAKNYLSL